MELTTSQWILAAFSFVIGIVVAMVLDEFLRKRDVPPIPRGVIDAIAFVGVSVLVAGMLVAPVGEALGLKAPPTPPTPLTAPGPTPANVGYVMAVVRDKYATPTTYISGATVGVYLTSPSPGVPSYAIQTKTTDANGGAFFELPGLTSGTVYLMVSCDNYYSDVKSTTIPGPQVYPTEALWAKFELAKIGQLSVVPENLTPNIVIDEAGVHLDNTSTDEQSFKLTLRNPVAGTAVRNLVLFMSRGSNWSANSPTVSVDVSAPSGITVSVEGDLNTGYTQTVKLSGDLTRTKTITITFSITLATPTSSAASMIDIRLDDLGQIEGKGYAGEAGIGTITGAVYV